MEFSRLLSATIKTKRMFLLIIYKRTYYDNRKNRTTWSADVQNETELTMDDEGSPQCFSRIFTDVCQENATREKRENIFLFYSTSVRVSNQLCWEVKLEFSRCSHIFNAAFSFMKELNLKQLKHACWLTKRKEAWRIHRQKYFFDFS